MILRTGMNKRWNGALLAMALVATLASSGLAQTVLSGSGPFRIDGTVRGRNWQVYRIDVSDWHGRLRLNMNDPKGRGTIYLRKGAAPTQTTYDFAQPIGLNAAIPPVELNNTTSLLLSSGQWFIGFYTPTGLTFSGQVVRDSVASHVPGMGALVRPNGTGFRVWAPNASSVTVAGDFNGWNGNNARMVPEGNGYHSLFHRSALVNQQYKYVIRNGTNTLWRQDPYSRRVTNSVGNSQIFDPQAFNWTSTNYSTPNWNDMVVYQMHIGTFNDTPGGSPGNFASAINRLDYLQELGINAIKLMPVNEFPGDFSWGYNPSQPFSVETAYGGPAMLQRFVDEAHKRGIAVMLDMVHNHYGPSDLDLWRFDGWSQGVYGGIYFYQDARSNTPWGATRPDYGRGPVRQYIRDNALYWLQDFRIDGFRWDATAYIRQTDQGDNPDGWSLMQWVNDEINNTQPWKISIAEDLRGNEWMTKTTGAGGAGFDAQWTPDFVHPMRTAMTTPWDGDRNMFSVRDAILNSYNGQWLQRVIYTESHDEVANGRARVPQEIDSSNPGSYWARKRSTLGGILTMTAPGLPMIFQGQEILEDEWFRDTDPIDWNKATTFAGVRQLYKDAIGLRRNLSGLTAGLTGPNVNVHHVNNNGKVVAFHRWKNGGVGDDVVVLMNWSNSTFNNYQIGLPRGGTWNVVFNSDWNGYGADYNNTFTADASAVNVPRDGLGFSAGFNLGPYSAVVLVQRPPSNRPNTATEPGSSNAFSGRVGARER